MTVNETLQSSQSTAEFKKSFQNATVYSNGVEAAQTGYNEMPLANSRHAQIMGVVPVQTLVNTTNQER